MDSPLRGYSVAVAGESLASALAARLLHDQGARVALVGFGGTVDAGLVPPPAYLTRDIDAVASLQAAGAVDAIVVDLRAAPPAVLAAVEALSPAGSCDSPDHAHVANGTAAATVVRIAAFAGDDPRGPHASEGELGAATGLLTDVHYVRARMGAAPVGTALPLASVYGGVWAAIGCAAALVRSLRGGGASAIDVPLADAAMSALGGIAFRVWDAPEKYRLMPDERPAPPDDALVARVLANMDRLGTPLFASYPCADGRRIFFNGVDHAQHSALLFRSLGLEADLRALGIAFSGDHYAPSQTTPPIVSNWNTWSPETVSAVRELLSAAFLSRPAAEWEELLCSAGVPAALVRTTDEYMCIPALREAGVTEPDGDGARPGTFVGTRRLQDDRGKLELPPLKKEERPLAGVEVMDAASVIAGPVAARVLAELGARVVRIETPAPGVGPRMTLWWGVDLNRGKLSHVADLKTPSGRARALSFFPPGGPHAVIHNKLPQVAARLGLSPADLAAGGARAVAQITAFGGPRPGPWSHRPSFDPVLQAAGGIMARYGTPEAPQLHAIASCIDYLTGYLAAFGTLCGLAAALRDGGAWHAETSLARATLCIQAPFATGRAGDEPGGQDAATTGWGDRMEKKGDGWVLVTDGGKEVRVLDHHALLAERSYDLKGGKPPPGSVRIRKEQHPVLGRISTVDPTWLRADWEAPDLWMMPWPGQDDTQKQPSGWPASLPP
ncbi:CoA-transferase family III domain-containing protein [Hyaloraphidium curvatum]|nr:CoA-transferase family III domain-containing protein [Hyaloraphidium curvatum]